MMSKSWQLKPKAPGSFIEKYPEYNRVLLQLLYSRGIKEKKEIKFFLGAKYKDAFDPFLFRDMEEASSMIIKHIKEGNKICIYGDYDADGITATALLFEILTVFHADCFVYIPDRVSEGYGLSKEAIDKISKKEAKLIITVDTGIRNKEEVKYAIGLGLEVVLTDHHPPGGAGKDLPDCLTINPSCQKETYPFAFLAGVGVAFKLAKALITKSKLEEEKKGKLEERLLDLVAIGSIADMIPLTGENRILVKKGLEVLNKTKRVGLIELIKAAGLEGKELFAWSVGFQIAPRINASSRMGKAKEYNLGQAIGSLVLLMEKNKSQAAILSAELNKRNSQRQKLTNEMVEEVKKQIDEQKDKKILVGICPSDKCWSEGIVGLVAGRIAEKYYKPTIVITRTEDGFKGSGRSIPEFSIAQAVDDASEFLGKHGGHPMACAFSFKAENLAKFIEKINNITSSRLANVVLEPKLKIDHELNLEEIDLGLIKEIRKLAPFGKNNKEPIFLSKQAEIKDIIKMGSLGQHIKFRFNNLWAVAFGRAEAWSGFKIGDFVDLVYNSDINKFNGREEVQLKIIDMKKANK